MIERVTESGSQILVVMPVWYRTSKSEGETQPILISVFFSDPNTYSCLLIQFDGHSSCSCIWLRVMYSSSSKMRSSSLFSSQNHIPYIMNFKLSSCSSWLTYSRYIVCSVPILHAIFFTIDEIQLIVMYAPIQITLMNPDIDSLFLRPQLSVDFCIVSFHTSNFYVLTF